MTPEELVEHVAEKIRVAYGKAVPDVATHIAMQPWASLPEGRKAKWRAMAHEAVNETLKVTS